MKHTVLCSSFVAVFTTSLSAEESSWTLTSPNSDLAITAKLDESQSLKYQITLKDHKVVKWSDLGLVTSFKNHEGDGKRTMRDFSKALTFVSSTQQKISETYTMSTGKRLENKVEGNEQSLTFKASDGAQFRVDLRAYDKGVAFRYTVLSDPNPKLNILYHTAEQELTSFNMGTEGKHFGQGVDIMRTFTPAYERPYNSGVPIGTAVAPKEGVGWGFPSLFETPKAWVLLHDSGYHGQYHAVHLSADPKEGVYRVQEPPANEAGGMGSTKASSTLPWTLPWRFMVVSEDVSDIVESNMVFDLAEPNKIKDTDWIKPGTVSWSWLSDHASSRDEAKLKKFIDLAAEMGWAYSLVDANWNTISETIMEDLVAYGKAKKVDLIFWYNSGGPHNWVQEEPRNLMHEPVARRAEFAKLQKLGVKAVKIDFFQSDKQFVMQQYTEILRDAADFQIMVDFHGCTAPRGWERTWPNLVTMESVRGAENYTFDPEPYAPLAPAQNTVLPFVRNVIGSMDYTPVTFSNFVQPHITTMAHEAALAVVFESGLLHPADSVEAYRALPAAWKKYLSEVPAAWDETKLVGGYPGREVVIARRKGKAWYVAGINGEDTEKELRLDLSLLTDREGTLLYDGSKENPYASEKIAIKGGTHSIKLQPYGGFVMIFK